MKTHTTINFANETKVLKRLEINSKQPSVWPESAAPEVMMMNSVSTQSALRLTCGHMCISNSKQFCTVHTVYNLSPGRLW